jgi:hypothetical protein
MAISQFPVPSSGGALNDFVLVVGSTGNTTYILERPYSAGRYFIDFVNNDTSYDIYFIAEDGTLAGYTSTDSALVTESFEEVVVLGAANNEIITFTYQGVSTESSSAGDVAVAGAFINSVVTANLPNVDDTTVVNGGNFAADVEVSFIGTNEVETAAKSVVRNSSTELLVTRPDSFSTANSPYDVKVLNPGIPAPTGSNRHILFNSVTAGTNPAWVTESTVFYNLTQPTSITLLATDTEDSDIDYTIFTGTLPAGLSLDSETGVISGTFSGSASEGDSTSMTFRATDAGGNFVDKAISLVANASPVWTTASPLPDGGIAPSTYSQQLVATGGTAGGALTYTLQSGTLPGTLTLSSSGLISGTCPATNTSSTFTVRVTDVAGAFADRTFDLLCEDPNQPQLTPVHAYVKLAEINMSGQTLVEFLNLNTYHSTYDHFQIRYNFYTGSNDVSLTATINGGGGSTRALDSANKNDLAPDYIARNSGGVNNMWYYHEGGSSSDRLYGIINVQNTNMTRDSHWTQLIGEHSLTVRRRSGIANSSWGPNAAITAIRIGGGTGNPPGMGSVGITGTFALYGIRATL